MEKPVVRISVRNLVEFILRNGDLDSGRGTIDKEAMLKRQQDPPQASEADGKQLQSRSFPEDGNRV